MTDKEVKEIFNEFYRKYGQAIKELIGAINRMMSEGDGDSLMLTRQDLLTIAEIISENLVKAGDPRAAKVENN